MRNKRRTDEEWLSLIQQCRSSGFSDRVWCEQNDISINTFYNTVTRLRKKSCMIPEYYGAAEPPVRCGESHLSGLTEPLRSL